MFFWGLFVFLVASCAADLPLSKFLNSRTNLASYRRCDAIPCRFSVTPCAFPPSKLQTAIGTWGAMGGLAAALGPSLGALLVDALGGKRCSS